MKRILVTGAAGFLGRHLCAALANRGDEVMALSRKHDDFYLTQPGCLVIGDAQDQGLVERLLSEYEIDAVVHLAAQTQVSVGRANPECVIRENVTSTLAVLEAARLQKTKRVVIASTDKVYGETRSAYTEDTPLNERTPYGASKACADIIAQTYRFSFGMSIAVTRCGNLYGPGHLNWSTLIPGTIRKFHRGERPVLRYGGLATRDFLYVADAVQAYLALIDQDAGGPFNFSGERPRTILSVAYAIANAMGKRREDIDIEPGGVGEIVQQSLRCDRARSVLGWKPETQFENGLERTVAWYQDHLATA